MLQGALAEELVVDLLRSGWIIERGRAEVYGLWAAADPAHEVSRERALERAAIVERSLAPRRRRLDEAVVEPHARWIRSLAGDRPGEVPLGNFLIARLGDWVDAHLSPVLDADVERLRELGDEERSGLAFPDELPTAPPYEPVAIPEVEPPGEVRFRFAILGDLHFGSTRGEATARAAVADLNASGAELVIQLGDLTDQGSRAEFELAKKVLGDLEMPLTTMMGNHDVYSREEERLTGRDYYPVSFGRDPDGIILEHKGMRFAVLDSVEHGASPFGPFDMVAGAFTEGPGGAIVRGSLTVPQHDLLAEVAAPGSGPAFVFLHHPPQPFWGFPPVVFGLRDQDSGRLHATVSSGNVWGVFAGHTHRCTRTRDFDGVPAQEVGIPRDFPFGFALVDVTEHGYRYRFQQLSDEELLRESYKSAGAVMRRYGIHGENALAFAWTR